MNLCSEDHEEVCYESKHCPACEVRKEKDGEISELKDKIADLEGEVADLAEQVS